MCDAPTAPLAQCALRSQHQKLGVADLQNETRDRDVQPHLPVSSVNDEEWATQFMEMSQGRV
ncbi:MAG: hypothetical protein IGR92_12210 [Leptolyngbyaceae cyanobacterium T60_A2020_046]|nr:hypothetical protein [Leptolyngbyaceae cyanobacterium T60_A2020_046]